MPIFWDRGDTVDKDDKSYYHNMNAFINHVCVAAITRDVVKIWQNLNICLKDEAEA
ncbi:hypothetical protein FQN51_008721 [Onygenales sp. PD_10]|nr:hypothetical protein FQN51_008721 [Onygenales sp. PD_10]